MMNTLYPKNRTVNKEISMSRLLEEKAHAGHAESEVLMGRGSFRKKAAANSLRSKCGYVRMMVSKPAQS